MKKIILPVLAATLIGMLFLNSCAKDDTTTPETTSSGDPRAKFHGHWFISEHSSMAGNTSYYVDIADSSNTTNILFAYLNGYHTRIRATVSGNNLTIPLQVVEGNNVSGGGSVVNANQVNLSYLVGLGGSSYDTITAVLTK